MRFALVFLVAAAMMGGSTRANEPAGEAKPPSGSSPVAKNGNQFAVDLYRQVQARQGNLFFSPVSISTAFAMVYGGAKGQTADQMAKVLHFDGPAEQVNADFAKLLKDWNAGGKEKGYQLDVANAIWEQQGYRFVTTFNHSLTMDYGAAIHTVDFAQSEQARKTINQWVSEKTQQKIEDLIPSGALNADSVLVLTNAIYFKATWDHVFNERLTKPDKFTLTDGKTTDVPMMHQTAHFPYLEGDGFSALAMSYAQNHFSMMVFLPTQANGLADFEKSLTARKLQDWMDRLSSGRSGGEARISFPKFKATQEMGLRQVLSDMGMPLAFTGQADFSGINGGREALFISDAFHKAYVDVDEKGTEAIAATGIVMGRAALPSKILTFNADHPFLFVIRDNQSGAILFMGRVVDPR